MNNERRTNTTGNLYGSYPGKVIDVEHPKGLYMAKVQVLGLWDKVAPNDLPWADFLLPLGAKPNAGHGVPVEIDDLVWVDFPLGGDTRYPRITGSIYHAPDYVSNLPNELFGKGYAQKRHGDEPPATAYGPRDDIYSRFGLIEQKSASGNWCITHKASGSAIEITPNGEIVVHCEGNAFRSSTGNTTENIGGELKLKITGPVNLETDGEYKIKAGGAVSIEAGGAFSVKATNADFQLG
ncbi:phage baseplate assembly protein V [Photobacterium leiognathi]|uniref:phage baseplate assembly protein V n=1 Tax=Photobacterium leiognathi TaxID=553611 RepID=UPI0029811806|nr:phage baseplate assembly protein V [Photobacterium leiognathi]